MTKDPPQLPIAPSDGEPPPGTGSGYRNWAAALCAALMSLGLGQAARAAPGDLDPSFDADGRVLTHFGAIAGDAPGRSDFATLVLMQPDGKLVVAGDSDVAGVVSSDVALARYNADGSLDASFGSGGRVLTDFQGMSVSSASIQPDGKILISGSNFDFFSDTPIVGFLARYDPDGSLDDSFGSGGRLLIEVSSILSGLFNFNTYLQPDGKLLVAGARSEPLPDGEFGDADLALARFNADGSLDASFGSGGRVITDDDLDNRGDSFGTLIRQPDGKLVVAGSSGDIEALREEFALTRYNPDGSLDASFGSGGRVFTDFDGRIENNPPITGLFATDLVVQPDGKLVGALNFRGQVVGPSDFLTRFNSDGSVDASFGSGGLVAAGFLGFFFGGDIIAQADGKLVVAGISDFPPPAYLGAI